MKRFAVRPLAAALVALACSTLTAPAARAAQVEVLHWWTSGGEAKSVEELKRMLAQQGVTWKDFAVAGGGGDAAMDALHARVDAGHPPTAAQIKGPAIQDWGRKGVLANLDDVAEAGNWDVKLPRVVAEQMKVGGHWAAVPVNVHRVNWLWINRDLLRKVGGVVPETWDQFFALAERFKAAGIIPLAHGDQPWQDLTTFEVVTLGVGGADFYRSVFVRLDPAAWRSPTMARVIDTFRRLKPYTDKGAANRDWNVATAMVIKGQAAMQIMGDWAKGEFLAAGKKPETDFICTAAPGTWEDYIYNVDSFAMFRLKDPQAIEGEKKLAATIMSPAFQEIFNRNKGSIPVALGADMSSFDYCARESSGYFVASSLANSLVPSFAHKMAQSEAKVSAVQAIVARLWDQDSYSGTQAQADLAA
ncbi:MAG TPA: ABC transporter substrate-binding protein, partial [Burkholderiaceae bacterium]